MRISDWSSDVCSSDLRISLTAFGIADLGYCPRRYGAAIGQDEVGARARSADIAASHHRIEAADMARKEHVSVCIDAPDRVGIGYDRQNFGFLTAEQPERPCHQERFRIGALTVEYDERSEEHTSELQSLMSI